MSKNKWSKEVKKKWEEESKKKIKIYVGKMNESKTHMRKPIKSMTLTGYTVEEAYDIIKRKLTPKGEKARVAK